MMVLKLVTMMPPGTTVQGTCILYYTLLVTVYVPPDIPGTRDHSAVLALFPPVLVVHAFLVVLHRHPARICGGDADRRGR